MNGPTTEAGRALSVEVYGVPRIPGDYDEDILAIEREAVAAYLASPEYRALLAVAEAARTAVVIEHKGVACTDRDCWVTAVADAIAAWQQERS